MAEELTTDQTTTDEWSQYEVKPTKAKATDDWSQYEVKKKPLPQGSKNTLNSLPNGGNLDPVSLQNTLNATATLAPVIDNATKKRIQGQRAHASAISKAQQVKSEAPPVDPNIAPKGKDNTSIFDDISQALYIPAINKGFSDLVIKPAAGATDFIDRTIDKAYQGITGEQTPDWLRKKGAFHNLSEWVDKGFEERKKPTNIGSEVIEGVAGTLPLLASLYTGQGEAKLAVQVPQFISSATKLLATTGAANAYKEATDKGEGYVNSLGKALVGGTEGGLTGLTIDAQMLVGGAMGKGVATKLAEKGLLKGGKAAEAILHALSVGTVFSGTSAAEDLLNGREIDTHNAAKQFGMGLAFEAIPVAKGLKDEVGERIEKSDINKSAAQNASLATAASNLNAESALRTLMESPKDQLLAINENIKQGHEDLYANSIEQGAKAYGEKNINEKRALYADQLVLKTQGDVKLIASKLKENAPELIKSIQESTELSPEQKTDLLDKVESLSPQGQGYTEVKPLETQTTTNEQPLQPQNDKVNTELLPEQQKETSANVPDETVKPIVDEPPILTAEQADVRKKAVVDSFKENGDKLSSIGTPEQYHEYLNTILPDSKIKDIVYHGSKSKDIESFKKELLGTGEGYHGFGEGFYFGNNKELINKEYGEGGKTYNVILDVNKNLGWLSKADKDLVGKIKDKYPDLNITDKDTNGDIYEKLTQHLYDYKYDADEFSTNKFGYKPATKTNEVLKSLGYDSITNESDLSNKGQLIVFDPEQVHILGSKSDIQGFKDWVENNKKQVQITDEPTTNTGTTEPIAKPIQQSEAKQQPTEKNKETVPTGDKGVQGKSIDQTEIKPDKTVKQSLTDAETQRKAELRKKFSGQLNDITRIPTLLADKEFREYAGLIFKEAAGDFKSFSKELIESVGEKIREHLPQLHKELEKEYAKQEETALKSETNDNAESSKELKSLAIDIPNGGEVKKYLSGETIEKYENDELNNDQSYIKQELNPALEHGVKIIEQAKVEFGKDYVPKTLQFIEENGTVESKALMYVSLENDLAARKLAEPENDLAISKLQDLVRAKSQAYLRSNAIAINMGRLRKFAEVGYDINKVTDNFFSTAEREKKAKVEKSIQSTPDEINKEAETKEAGVKDEGDFDVKPKARKKIFGLNESQKKERDALAKEFRGQFNDVTRIATLLVNKKFLKYAKLEFLDTAGDFESFAHKMIDNVGEGIKEHLPELYKKMGGVDEVKLKKPLTAEQKRKNYINQLNKRISSLDEQISNGEKKIVSKEDKYQHDNEINQLREERDSKNKELNKIDPSYRDTIVLNNALKSAEKSLLEYQSRLENSDFTKTPSVEKEINDELKKLREARDEAKSKYDISKKEYENSLITDEERAQREVEASLKNTEKSITELQQKLDNNDLSPNSKNASLWTKEIGELKIKQQDLQKEIEQRRKDARPQKQEITPEEKLADAKELVKNRIDDLFDQIQSKKRELKTRQADIEADAELKALQAEEAALRHVRDKELPLDKKSLTDEQKAKIQIKRLTDEIENIDKQIKQGEKSAIEEKKDPLNDEKVNKLKAEKNARLQILEAIDPNPKETVKKALIENGFGREITVTTKEGKEQREIIDWKKLAGDEGSVVKIQDQVEEYLRKNGYSDGDILRMQDAFVKEYNDLRASVIEKSLNELQNRNKEVPAVDIKTSAKRLSELYNYGLFDKQADTYDYLMNKALGLSDIGQDAFFKAKVLAKSLSDLFRYTDENGQVINQSNLKHAENVINKQIEDLLSDVAFKQSSTAYKLATIAKEYVGMAQRSMLVSVSQLLENTSSGYIARAFNKIGFSLDNVDTKDLVKMRHSLAKNIYNDINLNAALDYGDVNSPFLNKSRAMELINGATDSKVYHATASALLGRSFLEATDSMHKVALTEKFFTYNLIKVLRKKGMAKEEAVNYVSEQLTGQSFKDALVTSKEIIDKINTDAGKTIIPDNKESIHRFANDIVREALIGGNKLTLKEVEASFGAAYTAAGFEMGHEANNLTSMMVSGLSSKIQGKLKKAVKEKDWSAATAYTGASTIATNVMNPFVGGGSNWVFLGLQKAGVPTLSTLYFNMKARRGIDITSEAGQKTLQKDLTNQLLAKNANTRLVVGATISLAAVALAKATNADEDLDKWLRKNKWAKKYFYKISPPALSLMLAIKDKDVGHYVATLLNVKDNAAFDEGKKVITAVQNASKGTKSGTKKALGGAGDLTGSRLSTPLIPWRVVRDVQDISRGLMGLPPIKKDYQTRGFWNGYFKGGFAEYIGLRPEKD